MTRKQTNVEYGYNKPSHASTKSRSLKVEASQSKSPRKTQSENATRRTRKTKSTVENCSKNCTKNCKTSSRSSKAEAGDCKICKKITRRKAK